MACAPFKWQPHRILPYIAEKIQERYPTATFIPIEEFTMGTGINSAEDAQKVVDMGADAMIDAFAA
jgi:imidazole glycerol phosphate synthase subunit HisF